MKDDCCKGTDWLEDAGPAALRVHSDPVESSLRSQARFARSHRIRILREAGSASKANGHSVHCFNMHAGRWLLPLLVLASLGWLAGCAKLPSVVVAPDAEPPVYDPQYGQLWAVREWSTLMDGDASETIEWLLKLHNDGGGVHLAPVPGAEYSGVFATRDKWSGPAEWNVRGSSIVRMGHGDIPTAKMTVSNFGAPTQSSGVGVSFALLVNSGMNELRREEGELIVDLMHWDPTSAMPIVIDNGSFVPLVVSLASSSSDEAVEVVRLGGGGPLFRSAGTHSGSKRPDGKGWHFRTDDDSTSWVIDIHTRSLAQDGQLATVIARYQSGDYQLNWLSQVCIEAIGAEHAALIRPSVGGNVAPGNVFSFGGPSHQSLSAALLHHFTGLTGLEQDPITIYTIRNNRDIPSVAKRVPSTPRLDRIADGLWGRYGPLLKAFVGVDESSFEALVVGMGTDPSAAASHNLRAVWVRNGEAPATVAHELMHVLAPGPVLPSADVTLDQVLAAWLLDEGATEARARRLLGWDVAQGPRIVGLSTGEPDRLLLDLAYGLAPQAMALHPQLGWQHSDKLPSDSASILTPATAPAATRSSADAGVVPLLLVARENPELQQALLRAFVGDEWGSSGPFSDSGVPIVADIPLGWLEFTGHWWRVDLDPAYMPRPLLSYLRRLLNQTEGVAFALSAEFDGATHLYVAVERE